VAVDGALGPTFGTGRLPVVKLRASQFHRCKKDAFAQKLDAVAAANSQIMMMARNKLLALLAGRWFQRSPSARRATTAPGISAHALSMRFLATSPMHQLPTIVASAHPPHLDADPITLIMPIWSPVDVLAIHS
jgi:hypothetical protein